MVDFFVFVSSCHLTNQKRFNQKIKNRKFSIALVTDLFQQSLLEEFEKPVYMKYTQTFSVATEYLF